MFEETSEDLLAIIGMKDDDPEMVSDAKAAFNEFYGRFRDYVYGVCYNLSRSFKNREQVTKDLTQDTFIDVYKNAIEFDPDRYQDTAKGIKVWLAGISKFALLKYIDKAKRFEPESLAIDKYVFDIEDDPPNNTDINSLPSMEMQAVMNALNILNEKERDILLTYFQFYNGEKFEVPKEVRLSLARAHNVQPGSLRQIKGRAFEKVRKDIMQKTELTIKIAH